MKHDKRKIKRRVIKLYKQLGVGSYFIDCNCHPCKVTSKGFSYQDIYGAWVEGVSVANNNPTSCSLTHCGVEPISKEQADEMVKDYKIGGTRALICKYMGWTEEEYDQFEQDWR